MSRLFRPGTGVASAGAKAMRLGGASIADFSIKMSKPQREVVMRCYGFSSGRFNA